GRIGDRDELGEADGVAVANRLEGHEAGPQEAISGPGAEQNLGAGLDAGSAMPGVSLILQRQIDRRRECKRCRGSRLQQA
ncbi:MAG: hypothetical protein ACXWO3_13165, partial [Isosphaeraceae bacterium]